MIIDTDKLNIKEALEQIAETYTSKDDKLGVHFIALRPSENKENNFHTITNLMPRITVGVMKHVVVEALKEFAMGTATSRTDAKKQSNPDQQ